MQEGPTTAAVFFAKIRGASKFNGIIKYVFLPAAPANIKQQDPMDQMFTGWVKIDAATNPGIGVYAYGTRNPFGLTVGLAGNVMLTDNAANKDFGPAMLGFNAATNQPIFVQNDGVQTYDGLWIDVKEVSSDFVCEIA